MNRIQRWSMGALVGALILFGAGVALADTVLPLPVPAPAPPVAPIITPPLPPSAPKTTPKPAPATPEKSDLQQEIKTATRGTIDDWAMEQVDRPLNAMRRLYPTVGLTEPSLLAPGQVWIRAGFWSGFALGLLLLLFAVLNHSRHMLKGTDLLRERSPFARLAVPAVCLVLMVLVPWGWEFMRMTQEFVWSADAFDRSDPDVVLGVILPAGVKTEAAANRPAEPVQGDASASAQPQQLPVSTLDVPLCTSSLEVALAQIKAPCRDKVTLSKIHYPACLKAAYLPEPGERYIYPCWYAKSESMLYPSCTFAPSGSPCHEFVWWDIRGDQGPIKYPACGSEMPGLPCSGTADRHKADKLGPAGPVVKLAPPCKDCRPTSGTGQQPPAICPECSSGASVAPSDAGVSVAPVAASMGTAFGIGTGLATIILGILALAKYLIGRALIVTAPIYLGITAFSHRLEPTFGWVDIAVRTSLLLSLYNGAWLVMRRLPGWMSWTGVDSVVFVVLVLPLLLAAVWLFWVRRVWQVLCDPLLLNGGRVIGDMGRRASTIGRALAVAGGVVGAPVLATIGTTVSGWSAGAARVGGQVGTQASQAAAPDVGKGHLPSPTGGNSAPAPSSGSRGGMTPCWSDGTQFVTFVHGVPSWSPTQPSGTYLAGSWPGKW